MARYSIICSHCAQNWALSNVLEVRDRRASDEVLIFVGKVSEEYLGAAITQMDETSVHYKSSLEQQWNMTIRHAVEVMKKIVMHEY